MIWCFWRTGPQISSFATLSLMPQLECPLLECQDLDADQFPRRFVNQKPTCVKASVGCNDDNLGLIENMSVKRNEHLAQIMLRTRGTDSPYARSHYCDRLVTEWLVGSFGYPINGILQGTRDRIIIFRCRHEYGVCCRNLFRETHCALWKALLPDIVIITRDGRYVCDRNPRVSRGQALSSAQGCAVVGCFTQTTRNAQYIEIAHAGTSPVWQSASAIASASSLS